MNYFQQSLAAPQPPGTLKKEDINKEVKKEETKKEEVKKTVQVLILL